MHLFLESRPLDDFKIFTMHFRSMPVINIGVGTSEALVSGIKPEFGELPNARNASNRNDITSLVYL